MLGHEKSMEEVVERSTWKELCFPKENGTRGSRCWSFVVWNELSIRSVTRPTRGTVVVPRRSTSLSPLFCSCFKIFGLYERGRGVHKLYDVVPNDVDAKKRSLQEYNVPPAFSP